MRARVVADALIVIIGFSSLLRAEENWLDVADASWHAGSSPYIISSAQELAGLAQLVNEGQDFQGETVQVAADIDLSGRQWTPIGTLSFTESGAPDPQAFAGTFDGGGHVINSLTITNSEACAQGLFGVAANIKNVVLSNLDIRVTYPATCVGGIAGAAAYGLVSGCRVHGRIVYAYEPQSEDEYAMVGGILGINVGETLNCVSVLSNCVNFASVSGSASESGGILGDNETDAAVVNCVNFGVVASDGWAAGGVIAGNYGVLLNCGNFGSLTNDSSDGCFGGLAGGNWGTIKNGYKPRARPGRRRRRFLGGRRVGIQRRNGRLGELLQQRASGVVHLGVERHGGRHRRLQLQHRQSVGLLLADRHGCGGSGRRNDRRFV
jgi:hypothetical protein